MIKWNVEMKLKYTKESGHDIKQTMAEAGEEIRAILRKAGIEDASILITGITSLE